MTARPNPVDLTAPVVYQLSPAERQTVLRCMGYEAQHWGTQHLIAAISRRPGQRVREDQRATLRILIRHDAQRSGGNLGAALRRLGAWDER